MLSTYMYTRSFLHNSWERGRVNMICSPELDDGMN